MRISDWSSDVCSSDLVVTASLDPLRDQGRAYAGALVDAGVAVVFREARGNIHGFANLRRAIPSSQGDVAGALAALKAVIVEAEADRVLAQAAECRWPRPISPLVPIAHARASCRPTTRTRFFYAPHPIS